MTGKVYYFFSNLINLFFDLKNINLYIKLYILYLTTKKSDFFGNNLQTFQKTLYSRWKTMGVVFFEV